MYSWFIMNLMTAYGTPLFWPTVLFASIFCLSHMASRPLVAHSACSATPFQALSFRFWSLPFHLPARCLKEWSTWLSLPPISKWFLWSSLWKHILQFRSWHVINQVQIAQLVAAKLCWVDFSGRSTMCMSSLIGNNRYFHTVSKTWRYST